MKDNKAGLCAILIASSGAMLAVSPTGSTAFTNDPPTAKEPWHKYAVTDKNEYLNAWKATYPTSTIPDRMNTVAGQTCFLCHQPSGKGDQGNCYREDIKERLDQGLSIEQAIAAVANLDSDGDGTSNSDEILMPRHDLPGEVGYNPGLVGPTGTSPCSDPPGALVSNQPETPPAACYPDCDTSTGVGVLDIFDFLCFQSSFVAAEPYACDCDMSTGPGVCDIFDFLCFQSAFVGGCP